MNQPETETKAITVATMPPVVLECQDLRQRNKDLEAERSFINETCRSLREELRKAQMELAACQYECAKKDRMILEARGAAIGEVNP